jgi:transposase-like protein
MGSNILSGTRYSEKDKQQWVDWYNKKVTLSEICRRSGATRHTVLRWLKAAKVPLRGNERLFDRKAICREIAKGKISQSAIARKFGCSQRLVSDLARGKLAP